MIILETSRLVLRHQTLEDLDALQRIYSDDEVTRYIPDAPRNLDETREEIIYYLAGHPKHPEYGLWATVLKESGKYIGRCGLLPWEIDGANEVEVAYLIAREYWGKGYGTEAARAILEYGFCELNLSRLVSLIDERNKPSVRVAQKIGMSFEKPGEDEYGPFLLYVNESGCSKRRTGDKHKIA